MSDTVKSWIEERREAGRGIPVPVTFENDNHGHALLIMDGHYATARDESTTAIVDAHNMFPRALNALEQVLELHKPKYLVSGGEWIPGYCKECYSHDWAWPCATVQAIEGAINE